MQDIDPRRRSAQEQRSKRREFDLDERNRTIRERSRPQRYVDRDTQRERYEASEDRGSLERDDDYSPRGEREESEPERYYQGYYRRSSVPYRYPGGSGNLWLESWEITGPYTGKGPKGYRRSDQQILEDACQRLERDGDVDASDIEVRCENGVVTLEGTVSDRQTKRRAEECVESVYGVQDVMNYIRVAPRHHDAPERASEPGETEKKSRRQN